MSGGGGHMADMNNRMRQNRARKTSNKEKFKGRNRPLDFKKSIGRKLPKVTVSPAVLTEIKEKIRDTIKKERRQHMLVLALVLMLIVGLYYIII